MLDRLTIKNYVLIEDLGVDFCKGLNVFTGETGAGKSIIIEALGLALGDRADSGLIRKGAVKATIDAVFSDVHAACPAAQRCWTAPSETVAGLRKACLNEDTVGLLEEGINELILSREIDSSGKSRAYINGRPATLNMLSSVSDLLVDIHGQYDHQALLKLHSQLIMADSFGHLSGLREKTAQTYRDWKKLEEEIAALKMSRDEREKRIDLYTFQVKEIEEAALKTGEEEEIDVHLPQIKNADKLLRLAKEAEMFIESAGDTGQPGAVELLRKSLKNLGEIEKLSAGGFSRAGELENLLSAIKDLRNDVSSWSEKLETDPGELERLIGRKDLILKLRKKYGGTVEEILAYRDKIKDELEKMLHGDENLAELEKMRDAARKNLLKNCETLSQKRKDSCLKLEKQVEKEINGLGMPKARFKIRIEKTEINTDGFDKLEFLFSPNTGEDLKPLKEIASGGEMSRTMLAIKTALGAASGVPVMVFDEIDAGVSGPMGRVVGEKLSKLAESRQVFCITHLPQIASFAQAHFKVEKYEKNSRTCVSVRPLGEEAAVEEIARMLSGEKVTPSARAHAAELLKSAKK